MSLWSAQEQADAAVLLQLSQEDLKASKLPKDEHLNYKEIREGFRQVSDFQNYEQDKRRKRKKDCHYERSCLSGLEPRQSDSIVKGETERQHQVTKYLMQLQANPKHIINNLKLTVSTSGKPASFLDSANQLVLKQKDLQKKYLAQRMQKQKSNFAAPLKQEKRDHADAKSVTPKKNIGFVEGVAQAIEPDKLKRKAVIRIQPRTRTEHFVID